MNPRPGTSLRVTSGEWQAMVPSLDGVFHLFAFPTATELSFDYTLYTVTLETVAKNFFIDEKNFWSERIVHSDLKVVHIFV